MFIPEQRGAGVAPYYVKTVSTLVRTANAVGLTVAVLVVTIVTVAVAAVALIGIVVIAPVALVTRGVMPASKRRGRRFSSEGPWPQEALEADASKSVPL